MGVLVVKISSSVWSHSIHDIHLFSSYSHDTIIMQLWTFVCAGPLSLGMGVTIPMYPRLEGEENFHGGGGRGARYRHIRQSRVWEDAKITVTERGKKERKKLTKPIPKLKNTAKSAWEKFRTIPNMLTFSNMTFLFVCTHFCSTASWPQTLSR